MASAAADGGDEAHVNLLASTLDGNLQGGIDCRLYQVRRPHAASACQWAVPLVVASGLAKAPSGGELRPTPAKPHYTFNLRDLGKVFQGMLMSDPKKVSDKTPYLRLWIHECNRIFRDRLINDADRGSLSCFNNCWVPSCMGQLRQECSECKKALVGWGVGGLTGFACFLNICFQIRIQTFNTRLLTKNL